MNVDRYSGHPTRRCTRVPMEAHGTCPSPRRTPHVVTHSFFATPRGIAASLGRPL
jgi:hypothetical protein